MSRRDWVYLLSLLVPFVLYNLVLKVYGIAARPDEVGFERTLDLMRSDIFFNLGYALLWIGLFAAARGGLLRRVVVVLFHAVTMVVVLVSTCAHQYLRETGTTLDYAIVAEWLPKFGELTPILVGDVPLLVWGLLAGTLLYMAFGPALVTRAVERWRGWPKRSPVRRVETPVLFGSLGVCLLAFGFGSLSLLTGPAALARDPVVNLILTGVEEATVDEAAVPAAEHPAENAALAETPGTEKRNVVLIHLESTRAQSVTPYNEDLKTTPFLDEFARSSGSLLAERAYTPVPRSSKASVSVNCGVEPPLFPGPEFEPGGVPARCLAALLREQDYSTVFFASTANNMDNFGDVVQGFGYEEFYPVETMDTTGFQVTNTFGYEDDVMLEPSEEWLKERGDEPFLAEYFTGTGHYGYECVPNRYGYEYFSEDEELDRYHNCLRMLDFFVKNIIDQYKEMGLYEDTIFVIFGDHGEGFNEHGRSMHGDTIYDEGLRIPLIIHDPRRFEDGERVEGLSSQVDILPTVLEMLGYEVRNGQYPGYSLLREPPEDRTLRFSCITKRTCMASIKGYEKYIYHYENRPDELFDLYEDPLEQNDLAGSLSSEEREERREDLLDWRSRVNAVYGGEP